MKLIDKIKPRINYSNSYTIKNTLRILEHEFNLAVNNEDKKYAQEVIYTAQQLYDEFAKMNAEPGFINRLWIRRTKEFIAYLANKLKSEFDVLNLENQIEENISE